MAGLAHYPNALDESIAQASMPSLLTFEAVPPPCVALSYNFV